MAARLSRLLVALGLLLGAALPSAAAAVVRPPASHETVISLVPARGADPVYARSYFGARYYRADVGRFTTPDPGHVGGNIYDPQSWNAYGYARNNPLRFVDPEGLAYRVVVEGGKSPVWYLDDRQFEWMIAHPELNPGISFNNGVITAGGKTVGSYQHFDDSDAMIGLAGDLAAYGMRREGKEMAARAASGAIGGAVSGALSGGLAATEVLGIGRIAGGARVTFGHGARHLAGTGIPQAEAEAAIRSQVQSIARGASATGSFWGKVVVRGQKIFYRAFTRPDGSIHVGTYTVGAP